MPDRCGEHTQSAWKCQTPPPSFPRRREGGFTFEVQHLTPEYFGWALVAEALARRIVIPLQQPRKPVVRHLSQLRLPGQYATQPTDPILHAPLLPRRVRVAEERFDPQGMQFIVPHELCPVVERHRLPERRRQRPQEAYHGLHHGPCFLRRQPDGHHQARVPLVQRQHHRPRPPKLHQVCLPVAEGLTVGNGGRPGGDRAALKDEGDRTASFGRTPAALPFRLRQILSPVVVFEPCVLGVDEPVDALVGDDRSARLSRQPPAYLLRRPPPTEAFEDAGSQSRIPLQPGTGPAARAGLLLRVRRPVAHGA